MFDGSDWYHRPCLDGQRSTPELSAWCHDFGTTEDLGGLEDLTGFCVVSDTPMGRVTLDFEDTYGKLLGVTLRDENGSERGLTPGDEGILLSFSLFEEFAAQLASADIPSLPRDSEWRAKVEAGMQPRAFAYLKSCDDGGVIVPKDPEPLGRLCSFACDLFERSASRDTHVCIVHFPMRDAGFCPTGYADETFEVVFNGTLPQEETHIETTTQLIKLWAVPVSAGAVIGLDVVFRETGHRYWEVKPVVMHIGERFWIPLSLCDGMEEHWDIIVAPDEIDPLDWIENFVMCEDGTYRCPLIDQKNRELLESYPFRG